jgi:2',3'-cyclic-nucleotide 2'-phosphodiesterase (5'-nucleotidase family)
MARRRFLQSVGLSAAAVSTREPWQARAEAEAKAGQLTISLLNITDLHGHILPTQSYEGVENLGGFARCVTQIKQWRTDQPHSILLASNARVEGKWSNQLDKTHPLTARNLLLAGGP